MDRGDQYPYIDFKTKFIGGFRWNHPTPLFSRRVTKIALLDEGLNIASFYVYSLL